MLKLMVLTLLAVVVSGEKLCCDETPRGKPGEPITLSNGLTKQTDTTACIDLGKSVIRLVCKPKGRSMGLLLINSGNSSVSVRNGMVKRDGKAPFKVAPSQDGALTYEIVKRHDLVIRYYCLYDGIGESPYTTIRFTKNTWEKCSRDTSALPKLSVPGNILMLNRSMDLFYIFPKKEKAKLYLEVADGRQALKSWTDDQPLLGLANVYLKEVGKLFQVAGGPCHNRSSSCLRVRVTYNGTERGAVDSNSRTLYLTFVCSTCKPRTRKFLEIVGGYRPRFSADGLRWNATPHGRVFEAPQLNNSDKFRDLGMRVSFVWRIGNRSTDLLDKDSIHANTTHLFVADEALKKFAGQEVTFVTVINATVAHTSYAFSSTIEMEMNRLRPSDDNKKRLIPGVVIGVVIGPVLLAVTGFILWRRRLTASGVRNRTASGVRNRTASGVRNRTASGVWIRNARRFMNKLTSKPPVSTEMQNLNGKEGNLETPTQDV